MKKPWWCVVVYTDKIAEGFAGCANGPIIRIRPKYRADKGLLAHEIVHVKQFYRTFGMHGILYLLSEKYRFNAEVEAYREQTRYGLSLVHAATFIVTKYRLGRRYNVGHAVSKLLGGA